MTRTIPRRLTPFCALLALLLAAPASAATPAKPASASGPAAETLTFGRFGTLTLYRQTPQPKHVVLFVSGDGGWNLGVIDMARGLAELDALVVGIDIRQYLKAVAAAHDRCTSAAVDFEALSQYIQKKLNRPEYTP